MAYIYDLSDQWAASGTVFTGIKLNVTDTASAAGSLLMDLQVGGVSRINVTKTGLTNSAGGYTADASPSNIGFQVKWGASFTVASMSAIGGAGQVTVDPAGAFQFSSVGGGITSPDVILRRDAANTLAQRNGVNAQASRLYGTYTDASNYRRLTKTMSAAGVAEIKPEGAGTGVSGNVLHISGLPTSNPGPGILWNNAGTPAIGT